MGEMTLEQECVLLGQRLMQTSEVTGPLNILQEIVETATRAFGASAGLLVVQNIIPRNTVLIALSSDSQAVTVRLTRQFQPLPESLAGCNAHVLQEGSWFVGDGVEPEDLPWHQAFAPFGPVNAFAATLLQSSYEPLPIAILYLIFAHPQDFSVARRAEYKLFAQRMSSLFQEAWLHQQYTEIERIEQEINAHLHEAESVFTRLQQYLLKLFDASYSLLFWVFPLQRNTADLFVYDTGRIFKLEGYVKPGGPAQYVIDHKEGVFIPHRSLAERHDVLPYRVQSVRETEKKETHVFEPLVVRNETFGVISLQHQEPDAFLTCNIQPLQLLARHLALVLCNISQYDSLRRLKTTGQHLIQLFDSEQLLQACVDQIQEDTQADLAVLYPYDMRMQNFVAHPLVAGQLETTQPEALALRNSKEIVKLLFSREEPIFVHYFSVPFEDMRESDVSVPPGKFAEREKIVSVAAMALRLRADIVGVLFLNFRHLQRFHSPQKLFIAALINYAAIAIKNAQYIGVLLQQRTQEREILQFVEREVSHSLDLDHVLNTILQKANELIQAEEASILLYNKEVDVLETRATLLTDVIHEVQNFIIPLQEPRGITRQALTSKETIRVNDLSSHEWRELYLARGVGGARFVSELDVPLLDGDEAVGVLNFESTRVAAFSEDTARFLQVLAEQTVFAVKRAHEYDIQKRLADERESLNQINEEIVGQSEPSAVFDKILQRALRMTGASLGSVHLYDANSQQLTMVAEQGADEDQAGLQVNLREDDDIGIVGYVATTKKILNIDPASQKWNERYIARSSGSRSELAVPMLAGEELRGVLNVESRKLRSFSTSDERFLTGLANLAVIGLEYTERYQKELRARKRFELLYQAAQALGKLNELAQEEEAYQITEEYARQYNNHYIKMHRVGMPLPVDLKSMLSIPIQFNQNNYGYLLLLASSNSTSTEVSYDDDEIDRSFFDGLVQQLANTLFRLEETYSRKEAERRALLNEEQARVNELIFDTLHTLGNDLGLVRSYVNDIRRSLNRKDYEDPQIDKKLGRITQSVQLTLSSNRQIVDILRNVEDTQQHEQGNVLVHDIFRQVEHNVRQSQPDDWKKVSWKYELADEGLRVYATRHSVVHILALLVTNALENMSAGGTLKFCGYATAQGVALEVTDNGVGIDASLHKKIFQLGYSTKKGAGLGLWGARWHANLNQGTLVLLHSQPGQGSTFQLRLPPAKSSELLLFIQKIARQQPGPDGHEQQWIVAEPIVIDELFEELEERLAHLSTHVTFKYVLTPANLQAFASYADVLDILSNLVTNALDVMPSGGTLTLRGYYYEQQYVLLEVSDTGPGVDAQIRERVFERGYSTKTSMNHGYGLWRARDLAHKNQGRLVLLPGEAGRGATFQLQLPLVHSVSDEG